MAEKQNGSVNGAVASKSSSEEDASSFEVKKRPRRWTGYLFGAFAAITSATGSLFFKMIDENKLKVVLVRYLIQYLILIPIMSYKRIEFSAYDAKTNLLLLLRGFLSPLAMSCLGLSLNYLSLGDTMAIYYIYPSLVVVFACLCLKEKCGVVNVILTFVTMAGFVLVAQPSFLFGEIENGNETHRDDSLRVIGVLFALLASLSITTACIVIRKMGSNVHVLLSMTYTAWEGPVFVIFYLLVSGESLLPCWNNFPYIVAVSLCYLLSQGSQTLALQREKAGPITLIQSSQVVFSFLLQFIVLGEVPNLLCAVGAGLILTSCVVLGLKSFLKVFQKTNTK